MAANLVGPGGSVAISGEVEVKNDTGNSIPVIGVNSFVPFAYDEINMTYTGTQLTTVAYRKAGITVAILTLTYTGGNLTNVKRT